MEVTEFTRSIEIEAAKAKAIPETIGNWWKEVSVEASIEASTSATPGKLYAVGKYLVELVKNSLSDGKSNGKVTATFDNEKIKIVMEDFGTDEKEINLNVLGSYGMKEAIEYADDFMVEFDGRVYEKDKRGRFEEVDEGDLRVGSCVTFVKYDVAPPAEEEEPSFRGRNFGERMK